jgi:hypothetical protein
MLRKGSAWLSKAERTDMTTREHIRTMQTPTTFGQAKGGWKVIDLSPQEFKEGVVWLDSLSPMELAREFPSMDEKDRFDMLMMVRQLEDDGFAVLPEITASPDTIIQLCLKAMRDRAKELRAEKDQAAGNGRWLPMKYPAWRRLKIIDWHPNLRTKDATMALSVYQDYLGRPLKIGRDGKSVPYVEPPVKAPKPPKAAKATRKPHVASEETVVPEDLGAERG